MSGLSATMIPAVEQATGLAFRAIDATRLAPTYSVHARFSASYITGAHAVKVGFNHTNGWNKFTSESLNPISYRPAERGSQPVERARVSDRDGNGHGTQSGPLRAGQVVHSSPHGGVRPSLQLRVGRLARPESRRRAAHADRNLTFPAHHGFLTWHDLTPNLGAAYDVLRNGKTAVKVSPEQVPGECVAGGPIFTDPNPINTLVTSTTRSWTDSNRDYVPQCDLLIPSPTAECGAMANANFGQPVPGNTSIRI